MTTVNSLGQAFTTTTCRDRLRQLLLSLEDEGAVSREALLKSMENTVCPNGHDLHLASPMNGLLFAEADGMIRLSERGWDWLVENGRPSPDWQNSVATGSSPLRQWQAEALRAWAAHGRHGVIEAVTGTGKSRVGVEATREALADDYNVVIAVPTVDLVDQWVKTLRHNSISAVGALGNGQRATFSSHRVIVGTVQSLYLDPPTRPDGKVLLVADECHRYGAGQWRRALHPSYRRRLGLTATFERNDDGIKDLLSYFGGSPVFTIGFPRAIADGVVAHYDVKLLGVPLTRAERMQYDEADETLRDTRLQLLAADFPAEPFGAFLHEVQQAAEADEDPTITDVARRYLKAFSQRIDVMTNAREKINVTRSLAGIVDGSGGSIVFTRRVEMAEEIAATLVEAGVRAEPIHSDLTRTQRNDRLTALKIGRVKALVAPTILDEGIDVPDIDLAVVMGGSRSRRQMIQRMGRVLRLKADGRKATFIVVYAENTAEDLTRTDGAEGCLDLIIESADSVERLELQNGEVHASGEAVRSAAQCGPVQEETGQPLTPITEPPRVSPSETAPSVAAALPNLDSHSLPMTRRALNDFMHAHGVEEAEAETALRGMLADFQKLAKVTPWPHAVGALALRHQNLELVVAADRFITYRSRRRDALTWDDLKNRVAPSPREFQEVDLPAPAAREGRRATAAVVATGRQANGSNADDRSVTGPAPVFSDRGEPRRQTVAQVSRQPTQPARSAEDERPASTSGPTDGGDRDNGQAPHRREDPPAQPASHPSRSEHPGAALDRAVSGGSGERAPVGILARLNPDTCSVSARAVRDYRKYHEVTVQQANEELRQILRDFQEDCDTEPGRMPGIVLARALGFQLVLSQHGIIGYHPKGDGELTWTQVRDLPPVFAEVHPPFDVTVRHPFEQVPATSLTLTVPAFTEVARDYRLHDDYAAGHRSFRRDLAQINRERPEIHHRKDGSLLMRGTLVMVRVSPDGRRLIDVQRLRRSIEMDQQTMHEGAHSAQTLASAPPPPHPTGAVSTAPPRTADSPAAAATSGSRRQRETLPSLFAEDPSALLDVLDAATIAIDLSAVTHAAEAFDYGDPLTETALERTRSLLAHDLQSSPEIEFASDVFLVRGSAATWRLRGDGQVVLDLEPRTEPGSIVRPPASASDAVLRLVGDGDASREERPAAAGSGELDVVTQIERLAALRDRGLLTDEEFTAAKARILF